MRSQVIEEATQEQMNRALIHIAALRGTELGNFLIYWPRMSDLNEAIHRAALEHIEVYAAMIAGPLDAECLVGLGPRAVSAFERAAHRAYRVGRR